MRTAVILFLATAIAAGASIPRATRRGGEVDFARDVRPILESSCWSCHGAKKQSGELRLDVRSAALKGGASARAIVPGKPDESLLMQRVLGLGDDDRMPLEGAPLSASAIDTLRAWIASGAAWPDADSREHSGSATHWAYVAPARPALPHVKDERACRNAIDRFVNAKLDELELAPAREADRATLIRRLSLDLIGLPPTPEEVAAFVNDDDPGAYDTVVDRLLASPRYGERWARPWLDLARYADTNGYEKDLPRSLWPWRDWVIRALNADMPYDEFTVKQLAGDLLDDATDDDRVATGFHRNTMLNDEGGIDPEEFRMAALVDRVNTTATVWLGTTLACAQCHDHKYDPFTQKEYYEFLAFFDSTEDTGVGNGPEMPVPNAEQREKKRALETRIAEIEPKLAARDEPAQLAFERDLQAVIPNDAPLGIVDRWSVDDEHTGSPVVDLGQVVAFERTHAFSYGALIRSTNGGWDPLESTCRHASLSIL